MLFTEVSDTPYHSSIIHRAAKEVAGHLGGNNVGQQLLPLILTACRDYSGMNESLPGVLVVRDIPESSIS